MRIVVPDDYQGAVAQLPCLQQMQGHQVQVLGALDAELDARAARLADADALGCSANARGWMRRCCNGCRG